jgi:APA family basic amino acid/polyamine antiporter
VPLLRILGVAFGVAVVIGTSIGAGILRSPGPVVALTGSGPLALLLWALGGTFALLAAAALADVATTVPRSGGLYVFAHRALGSGFGFAIGCADWFANCTAVAYGALTVVEYAAKLEPSIGGYVLPAAGGVIILFAGLQLTGMRVSSRFQEVVSFVKAAAFIALIAGLLMLGGAPADSAAESTILLRVPPFVSLILALQLILSAYDGWQSATYFAGEDRDPGRNLPRSLIGGVLTVIVVYLLMNVALLRVLPIETFAASTLPAADAARLLMGTTGETVITFLSILSPFSLVSAVLLCAPRILYAMAADRLIPAAIGYVDGRGTPSVALLLSTLASLAMLSSGTFEALATIGANFAVISYAGAFVSLLVLRTREPNLPRPFRSWGYPWTTVLVLAAAIGLLAGTFAGAPRQSLIAIVALAASYPVFRLTRGRHHGQR